MNLRKLWIQTKKELDSSNINDSIIESEVILRNVLNLDRNNFFATLDKNIPTKQKLQIQNHLKRRLSGVPLSYITNNREFFGINFFVNKNVLIPRQESELLVEKVISFCKKNTKKQFNIIDVGTGSGAIGISIAKHLNNVNIIASDISDKALQIAKKNANLVNVNQKMSFINSNLLEKLKSPVDVIVANLPYLCSSEIEKLSPEVQNEPKIALFAECKGISLIKKLVEQAPNHLKKNGKLILEISPTQVTDVLSIFKENFPESYPEIHDDYTKMQRAISVET